MIDPNSITTIRVGQLADAPLNLTDNIPHEVGTDLKRATIQELVDFVANAIEVGSGVGYLPLSVTDGQQLPDVPENPSFFLCGVGTFLNINGFPDIICTENLNAIMSLSDHWEIAVEIPITFDTPGSIISQSVTEGVTNFAPSEDAVFNFGETLEKIANKVSEIVNYSEVYYPNEKAVHDALDLKLNISDLPSNLIFYATTAVADISGYFKLVDNLEDPDYDEPAVDVSTGAITTTNQLISSLVSAPGLLIGNPGEINITTVGNIKRISGTGTADFYFKAFHRDGAGVETLVGTSNNSQTISNSVYEQFSTTLLWNNGDFIDTDRIVLKFYANRISGGGNPTYNFQFGGATPVRTIIPVPFYIVAGDYELKANKQNSLTADLTNTKYPTVTAVIAGLTTKQNTLTNPITGTGNTNFLSKFTSANTQGNSLIFDNGTNLGVGTTAPQNKLEIEDIDKGITNLYVAANLAVYTSDAMSADKGGSLSLGGKAVSNTKYGFGAIKGAKENSVNGDINGYLSLYTSVSGVGSVERMRITSAGNVLIGTTTNNGVDRLQVNGAATFSSSVTATNFNSTGASNFATTSGNVGIGTTSPSQKLSVSGNISLATGGYIYGDTTTPHLRLSQTNGSFLVYGNSGIGLFGSLADIYSSDRITLQTNSAERMRITSAGNVLIGTTTNNGVDRLQVNGSILATTIKKSGAVANQLLQADGGVTVGYKVYTALLTRTGATAPSPIVLENTLGTITFSYNAVGTYYANSSSLFTLNKTAVFIQNQPTGGFGISLAASRMDINQILILQSNSISANDQDWSFPVSIEIRVYN